MKCSECEKSGLKTVISMNKRSIEVCEECAKLEKFKKYKSRFTIKMGKPMTLLPPAPHLCQECATAHNPESPHNAQSLYYQTQFNMKHKRCPTWADAMAHCCEDIKRMWVEELNKRGVKI